MFGQVANIFYVGRDFGFVSDFFGVGGPFDDFSVTERDAGAVVLHQGFVNGAREQKNRRAVAIGGAVKFGRAHVGEGEVRATAEDAVFHEEFFVGEVPVGVFVVEGISLDVIGDESSEVFEGDVALVFIARMDVVEEDRA